MRRASALAALIALGVLQPGVAGAQQSLPPAEQAQQPGVQPRPNIAETVGGSAPNVFMQVPVSTLSPGAVPSRPMIKNPVQGDPQATGQLRHAIDNREGSYGGGGVSGGGCGCN